MDISATTAIMALNAEWLQNGTSTVTSSGVVPLTDSAVYQSSLGLHPWTNDYCYPPWSYPVYVSSPARPIKLTLREVELLRESAQRDSRVRAILEKFTPLIEVSVSFEDR